MLHDRPRPSSAKRSRSRDGSPLNRTRRGSTRSPEPALQVQGCALARSTTPCVDSSGASLLSGRRGCGESLDPLRSADRYVRGLEGCDVVDPLTLRFETLGRVEQAGFPLPPVHFPALWETGEVPRLRSA